MFNSDLCMLRFKSNSVRDQMLKKRDTATVQINSTNLKKIKDLKTIYCYYLHFLFSCLSNLNQLGKTQIKLTIRGLSK